jgi:hypothetical protein
MPLVQSDVFETVRVTFEEMSFLDVAPGPPSEGPSPTEGSVLFLGYTQPKTGSFELSLPKSIKFQVAEAIYGENWDALTPGQLDDSLLELMNVLAGRLLTQRFGAKTTYSMGLPTILFEPPVVVPRWDRENFEFHIDQARFSLVWSEEAE